MRAITIRQPWAGSIFALGNRCKDVENRSWSTTYRGTLAIHSGARPDTTTRATTLAKRLCIPHGDMWEFSRVLGTVDLVDCVQDARSQWAEPDCWHWVLRAPRVLKRAVYCKGKLGLWTLDHDTLHRMGVAGRGAS